jgi:hypothetical protein
MTNPFQSSILAVAIVIATLCAHAGAKQPTNDVTRAPVVFSGGHETDPRDHGRPVVLIAAALGVSPDVFREAFSQVHPAPAGSEPSPAQVRENKAALLAALGKHGVTNEKLDNVSNYYRYVRSRNELWPTKTAVAYALVKNGKVIGYEVTSGGSGYSSPPTVSVPNFKDSKAKVELSFGKVLENNGAISAITVPQNKGK